MKRHLHFIGIGGIGMSAVAKMVLQRGDCTVSGSDQNCADSYVLEDIRKLGALIYEGHDPSHVTESVFRVIASSDIAQNNVELEQARRLGIEIIHRSDLLAELLSGAKSLLVSGTHGKTTTSALLSHVLSSAYGSLSFAVGGIVKNYKTNARLFPRSEYFVAEADESDGSFLKYSPYGAIITNIDSDHLAYYGSLDAIQEAFAQFGSKVQQPEERLFVCGDCPRSVAAAPRACRYGYGQNNDVVVDRVRAGSEGIFFDVAIRRQNKSYESLFVPLFGRHNALNAAAVFAMALQLGVEERQIRSAFETFQGVARRLDCLLDGDIAVFDDYAHHPAEVQATLAALKASFSPRRIVVVFQPHRPSRIRHILDEFSSIFQEADALLLTDIFKGAEVSSDEQLLNQELVRIITTSHPDMDLLCLSKGEVLSGLSKIVRPADLVVFMGAGDSTKLARLYAAAAAESGVQKYRVAVVYGGMNSENKISRLSARAVWESLDSKLFDKTAFLIETDGYWTATEGVVQEKVYGDRAGETISGAVLEKLRQCDIAFPVVHGPFGEDGTIQGFFEIIGLPYVGADCVGCAVSMDKAISKILAAAAGVPVVPFKTYKKEEWFEDPLRCMREIEQMHWPFPLFVKPVHLGSSVGVKKVESWDALKEAVQQVFLIDDKLLVELGLTCFREIEFAPMGSNAFPQLPQPGEILAGGRVYDYQSKYGKDSFQTSAAASLPQDVMDEGLVLAKKAFRALELKGLARIDFFLSESGQWYFNEANPMPGFTDISLYPSMWKAHGVSYSMLLQQLIAFGLHKHREVRSIAQRAAKEGLELELSCALA